jgi:16S rRNA (adenine1518-N6/adenine1519-N6)-dimethyltransferase
MAPPSPARQTLSYLAEKFRRVGLQLEPRYGQNFLIDLNLHRLLVDAAALGPQDVVLEVGTGTGALTAQLAARAGAVVSCEIDRRLFQLASEELLGLDNVTLRCGDALDGKQTISAELLALVAARRAALPGGAFRLVANLPYNIATPLIANLLALESPPQSMTVTVQKELADRLLSGPGTKDYGGLSVWVQCQCRASLVRLLPPQVFWPRPRVTSAIVHLELDLERRRQIPDLGKFQAFCRNVFLYRRKLLRAALSMAVAPGAGKGALDQLLAELGLGSGCRAEALSPEQLLVLAQALEARFPGQ